MNTRRLQAAQDRINRFPYRYEAIDEAYARFLDRGVLPDDNPLAWRVLERVLHARKPLPPDADDLARAGDRPLYQPYGGTREMLFREACCSLGPARALARLLLRAIVQAGYDPTDAALIGPEMEPTNLATISMRLLGWPQDYVRPQYRAQLDRLLEQQGIVQANRPRSDAEWDRGAGRALSAFLTSGILPSEPRFLPFVLTTSEQLALHGHYFGRGSEDLLASFDAIATGSPADREAALGRLGELQVAATEERR
ncbi:MAG: hypothetical protein KDE27_02970 [Planctomycetes bacterium]|nr:hypothetical protein [Planctomycetota bacterium]